MYILSDWSSFKEDISHLLFLLPSLDQPLASVRVDILIPKVIYLLHHISTVTLYVYYAMELMFSLWKTGKLTIYLKHSEKPSKKKILDLESMGRVFSGPKYVILSQDIPRNIHQP